MEKPGRAAYVDLERLDRDPEVGRTALKGAAGLTTCRPTWSSVPRQFFPRPLRPFWQHPPRGIQRLSDTDLSGRVPPIEGGSRIGAR